MRRQKGRKWPKRPFLPFLAPIAKKHPFLAPFEIDKLFTDHLQTLESLLPILARFCPKKGVFCHRQAFTDQIVRSPKKVANFGDFFRFLNFQNSKKGCFWALFGRSHKEECSFFRDFWFFRFWA
jgi:hypothetical protein